MKKRKGFTLIELLIVIVIIAVLASLILPRFINQPEKAMLAEAHMQLGAIRRAQLSMADAQGLNPSAASFLALTTAGTPASATEWANLGLTEPDSATRLFNYSCTAGVDHTVLNPAQGTGTCTARREGNAGRNITISLARGTYTCSGYVSPVPATQANRRGCI